MDSKWKYPLQLTVYIIEPYQPSHACNFWWDREEASSYLWGYNAYEECWKTSTKFTMRCGENDRNYVISICVDSKLFQSWSRKRTRYILPNLIVCFVGIIVIVVNSCYLVMADGSCDYQNGSALCHVIRCGGVRILAAYTGLYAQNRTINHLS